MYPYKKSLKQNSRILRSNQTDPEEKLWAKIRHDQLLGFRFYRQKPLLNYIVDFYCPKAKLIIELDGSQHYEKDHQEQDQIRDAELSSLGLRVLRFDNGDIYNALDGVLEEICEHLMKYQQ